MSSEKEKIRLGLWQRRVLYWSFGLLWVSGAWWVGVELQQFFGKVMENRTASQVSAMKAHGALAMLFLLVLGSLKSHVQRGWELKVNRLSGASLIGLFLVLTVTGWLLYYAVGDGVRTVSSIGHWTIGLAAPVLLWLHVTIGRA